LGPATNMRLSYEHFSMPPDDGFSASQPKLTHA
jgi:hypothetical protein